LLQVVSYFLIRGMMIFCLFGVILPERLCKDVLMSNDTGASHQVTGMPDDQALESRTSAAAECLRLAASARDPASRVSLLLLAQKWIQWANKRAAKAPAADALLPERDRPSSAS
jgi:hypothetical protein